MISINDGSEEFARKLLSLCNDSPYGAKIISYFKAYKGRFPFLDFWLCRNEEGETAVCRYYSAVFLCGEESEEVKSFIGALSPSSVLCDGTWELELPGMKRYSGEMLSCSAPLACTQTLESQYAIERLSSEMRSLKAVYELLRVSYNEDSPTGDFESFFIDTSHMIRHNTSSIYAVSRNGELLSTLTASSITDSCAVIGSVATLPNERSKGLASILVNSAVTELCEQGRRVFLFREAPIRIYERVGFKVEGYWAEYRRGD